MPQSAAASQASRVSRATKPGPRAHPVPWVRRLPRKTTVDVRLCHACHVKSRWMSPSPTPATQSAAASRASRVTKPGPRVSPSAMSEAPATQNDRGCEIVPRLPCEIKVDVTKSHACHAKCRGVDTGVTGVAQGRHPVPWVRRLPRKTTVDVRLCHGCHVKSRWMSWCSKSHACHATVPRHHGRRD